ncbi:MAG TPA: hypothetical protein VFO33_08745, partial [Casimicrobiaceae bacterium]|nr:hypothetical protein [Casimicrobiaceae bacterium]
TASRGRVCIVASSASKANVAQASMLRDALGGRAEVIAAASGRSVDVAFPASTLVQFDLDVELATPRGAPPARVFVRMNRDDPEALVRALARLRDTHPGAQLQYTRPFGDAGNGAAKLPVEYPWIDPSLSGHGALHAAVSDAVTVGRAYRLDDHPNDPALYRRLMAGGIRIATPSTPFLVRAFRDDPTQSRPLWQTGATHAMPDIVLLRLRPGHRGRADASILEALAAARSVVVFEDTIGAREWIDHGRNGFIVRTETEAEACVAELARDSELRAAVGLAARVAAVRIMDVQRANARVFYLGVSVNE